jgi:signal transduction histidine kinase
MILIVDDKQENIFSIRTVLEQYGFKTDSALSGEDALKKLLKNEYSLIILDVQMPMMDGFEVAEAITGLNKTRDIPIIFLSAVNTHKKFITKGFESGGVEYLTKPVDPDILILKVRNFRRLYEKTTALKEAQKSLSANVQQLRTTLEALPQLAFTADRNGKLEYVNQRWFDYSPSKDEFPETEDCLQIKEQWLQNIRKSESCEMEVLIKNINDGAFYYHLLKATPVMQDGVIVRWVGTLTNIHHQKMLNETLEQKVTERTKELLELNRQLEISNHDLQQFTFVASHDLKEPLRKIQLYSNMIKERTQLEGRVENYFDKILNASDRMNTLINDLLSFGSLSAPNLFALSDLNQIINDILVDLELSIEAKNAMVQVGKLPTLEVVPGLVRQLFQNIISNAIKFSKPGVAPRIHISADIISEPTVEAPPTTDGTFCRIQISDNGIGFEEKYAQKIFTIFQRLNNRTEYEGTGIGLAIVKKIMDRHNGFISAKSNPGEGSTFYVIFPVQQEQQPAIKEDGLFN